MLSPSDHLVRPGTTLDLEAIDPADDGGLERGAAKRELAKLHRRLEHLQELLFADASRALLVVLQAMDTGGKDSTIRSVFGPLNPQGCHVAGFRVPSELERRHDFLWRIHQQVPQRGLIGVFNRSHYEDVLVVRVKGLPGAERWKERCAHIKAFERLLHDEGTVIRKFYLHISADYQKKRLLRRLRSPDKLWKFNPDDLRERLRWREYRRAYEDAISRTSTEHGPWYIVPAETRWFRNLLVARIVVDALESMDLKYPEPTFDPKEIVVV